MQTTRTPYSVSFMATVLLLLLFACHSTIANAAVALGATRVIYPANQKQVLLPVTNNDPASVYLIQSWIENAGDQKDTQFVITPPLFSMQGKKENTLRIINATNHQLPGDREILFWVNVKDQHQTQMMRQPNDPEVVCMRCCPAHVFLPNVPCCLIMLIFLCQD